MSGLVILPRVQLGDPILRAKAKRLSKAEITSPATAKLVERMYYTLKRTGGVGLAAPQAGQPIRLAVLNVRPNKYHPAQKKRQRFVIINPEIVSYSKKSDRIHEGCLSFLDLFGEVERPTQIQVKYQNEKGELVQRRLNGLVARVFQHEFDHLNGEVWVDKANDTKTFMTRKHYLRERKELSTSKVAEEYAEAVKGIDNGR